jgi:zinc/manganese transport system substrate-binding protein
MHRWYLLLVFCLLPLSSRADLEVFACEPEWAALAVEIGGELVDADSATTALQDPHYIQARPSLIAHLRNADLLVCSGAQLEIGWLPVLLRKANNRDVMPGNPGYFEASLFVEAPRRDLGRRPRARRHPSARQPACADESAQRQPHWPCPGPNHGGARS